MNAYESAAICHIAFERCLYIGGPIGSVVVGYDNLILGEIGFESAKIAAARWRGGNHVHLKETCFLELFLKHRSRRFPCMISSGAFSVKKHHADRRGKKSDAEQPR